MPYTCYTKCYDATVQSIIDYSAALWGTKSVTCINAVQNRACRYFLGLGRYAPNVAVDGDMGWTTPEPRHWLSITRRWCRLINMDDELLAKRVFNNCLRKSSSRCKTWCYRVQLFYIEIEHAGICNGPSISVRAVLRSMDSRLNTYYENRWKDQLNSDSARRGPEAGGNKLRTYRRFKEADFTESYVKVIIQKKYRSAYAKFRCGVAPIKIETCRYGLNRVPVEQRVCEIL